MNIKDNIMNFFSSEARQKNKAAKIRMIKFETQAIEKALELKKKNFNAMIEMVKPTKSLNDELYGSGNQPYASKIWQSSPDQARRLSRIAYWESPSAQALVGRFTELVYGPKLDLQASPVWDIIPGAPASDEKRQALIKQIESRYRLWAKSEKSDYSLDKNHYKRSRQNFKNLLLEGEYFCVLRYPATRKRNPLTVQIVKPDHVQCMDKSKVGVGNKEVDGIEYNSKNQAVAYHILVGDGSKSKRVPKFGPKSGKQFVIHNKLGDGLRGTGILAGIITELTKIADFQALEIQAAVVNALFAVWVETEQGSNEKPFLKNTAIGETNYDPKVGQSANVSDFKTQLNTTQMQTGGVLAQPGEGQKMHSFDTKRPTPGFGEFMNEIKKNLYAAKSMSRAVADFDFDGSYSAARGELLVFWNKVLQLRFDHACDYEDKIYSMWLMGENERGVIDMPGFNNDETIFDAWCNAKWTGPTRPDIDPTKSAQAHKIEDDCGYKTKSQITAERGGGDYDENIERKKDENIKLAEVNSPLIVLDKTSYSHSENKTESKSESTSIDKSGKSGGNE